MINTNFHECKQIVLFGVGVEKYRFLNVNSIFEFKKEQPAALWTIFFIRQFISLLWAMFSVSYSTQGKHDELSKT